MVLGDCKHYFCFRKVIFILMLGTKKKIAVHLASVVLLRIFIFSVHTFTICMPNTLTFPNETSMFDCCVIR